MAFPSITYQKKIIPDAYHGTTLRQAEDICGSSTFVKTRYEDSYLGDGVYFYESSYISAVDWSVKIYGNDAKTAVLKCSIDLGKCFDLHNKEHQQILAIVSERLRERVEKVTDAFAINYLATNIVPDIDTVRCPVVKKSPQLSKIFSGSRIYINSEIYICVRNLAQILSIQIYREEP